MSNKDKRKQKSLQPTMSNVIKLDKIHKAAKRIGISCFVASFSLLFYAAARDVVDVQSAYMAAGAVLSGAAGAVASEVSRRAENESHNMYFVISERKMWERRRQEYEQKKVNEEKRKFEKIVYDQDDPDNEM